MTEGLQGKVCVVTGASSGIGAATARRLAGAGATVVLAARRQQRLDELVSEIEGAGGRALAIEVDVTNEEQARGLIERANSELGRVDVLVNNAGVMLLGPIQGADTEEWRRMVEVNLLGLFYCTHAALPVMRDQGGGHIVNVSSVAGRTASLGVAVYNATKWALRGFNESWREELYPKRIKVAYVAPGFVITEFGQRKPGENESSKEWAMMPQDVAHHVAAIVTQAPNSDVKEIVVQVLDRS